MTTIVHRTPGLLDTRSFTVMGMSAKPQSGHPIGQFGTGLKYSIAGLLRSGASVAIWIGREHWQFELETEDFRGEDFVRIVAWVRSWGGLRRRKILLPYASNLGPHWTWWMWLRELHSNTLDEGGETQAVYDEDIELLEITKDRDENSTLIVVTHPDYATAWETRADVFLPGATPLADVRSETLQCLPAPSQRAFYRGVRALDLRVPALYTYNILTATPLTEDRTMSEWYARHHLANWLLRECTDQHVIQTILEATDENWEHDLELPHHVRPSPDFEAASRRVHRMGSRLTGYTTAWAPPPPPDTRTFWERRGRRWQLAETEILDERGSPVVSQPEDMSQDDWRDFSEAIVLAVRPVAEGTCPTCHQEIAPSGEPVVLMTAADLYSGLSYHDFERRWVGEGGNERQVTQCTQCGVHHDDELMYDPCEGPAWMQPVSVGVDHGQVVSSSFVEHDDDVPFL